MFNAVVYYLFIKRISFEVQFNEVSRNDQNYIFREFECGLTVEQAAELCLKTVRTVKKWDKGKTIPPECKRLMRMTKGWELSHLSNGNALRCNMTDWNSQQDCLSQRSKF